MANLKKIFKVIVLTGSRAEYGLLRPLIKKIEIEKNFKNFLICTGMHLSPEFGLTVNQIEIVEGFGFHKFGSSISTLLIFIILLCGINTYTGILILIYRKV